MIYLPVAKLMMKSSALDSQMTFNTRESISGEHSRRIIAEDPDWSLTTVPLLKDLVLNHIAKNFEHNPILKQLKPKDQTIVLEKIAVNLPLQITADLIDDEKYWQKCCQSRWEICEVSLYNGNWKRMFFERYLETLIENYVPLKSDLTVMHKAIALCGKYIKRLVINQLLPPVNECIAAVEESQSECGSESLSVDFPVLDHFEFSELLHHIPHLEELRVRYRVRDCGMNFEWKLFQFTKRDCLLLASFLRRCQLLKSIYIQESHINDDNAREILKHLLDHPCLNSVNLSHNLISDRGARAVAKLINNRCPNLTKVDLYDNIIGAEGAKSLAFALKKNKLLEELNLRLNRIGDEGGKALCHALMTNTTLKAMDLTSNNLGEPTAAILAHALLSNMSIRYIGLAGNIFGKDGGKQLLTGIEKNNTLIEMDLRLTDIGQNSEYFIQQKLHSNLGRYLVP